MDDEYVNRCQIPPEYKGSLQRGYYSAEQVANFKAIWHNAPIPRAWIPLEIFELEIKSIKDQIRTALNEVLDQIKEKIN